MSSDMSSAMNPTPGTVSRALPADLGLDYTALVAEGTRLVQALSGKIWTNFNYSDPGVTILEQLCYALTELSFRAGFPVQDLLGAPGSGHIALPRQGLYPARAIMPINPVTPDDLRRLLIDRVPGIANAWATPLRASQAGGVNGLYSIAVLAPAEDCDCDDGSGGALLERVLDCYNAHRALCEDVHACYLLEPIPTRVHAEVALAADSDPDAVLAQLLFVLGLCLSPEPRRTSLAEQLAAGLSTSDIFRGPLMLHGFIDDGELTPLPRQMAVETLLEAMAEVPGVLSVDNLTVHAGADPHGYGRGEVIELPEGAILQLATSWRGGAESMRLHYGNVPCTTHRPRVRRLYERAWAAQRQTYPLWAQYRDFYRPPAGRGLDLAAYSSVQEQFPVVYGIGSYGLPPAAGPARHGQARQLKGYLMAFDQLMANYFSQLAFVRDLFSVDAGGDRTYAWQSLRGIVPHVAPLLLPGYEAGLAELVAAQDPVGARQTAVLDFLLSLYATHLPTPAPTANGAGARAAQEQALIKAKQALLERMTPATRDRGRGADYRRGGARRHSAGMVFRCRIELALLDAGRVGTEREPAADFADETAVRLLPEADAVLIVTTFAPVDIGAAERAAPLVLEAPRVAAALLPALADVRRYRVGSLRDDGLVSLVCRDVDERWWLLGQCLDQAQAVALAGRLVQAAGAARARLYIVEWILLRHGAAQLSRDGDGELGAAVNFRISAVLPLKHDDADTQDTAWRSQEHQIVRENTPAHIAIDMVFLGPRRMRRFIHLYEQWGEALRHGTPARRAETSRRLARFLRPPAVRAAKAAATSAATSTANSGASSAAVTAAAATAAASAHAAANAAANVAASVHTAAAATGAVAPSIASVPASAPIVAGAVPAAVAPEAAPATASAASPAASPEPAPAWWQFWRRKPVQAPHWLNRLTPRLRPAEPAATHTLGRTQRAPAGASGAYVRAKLDAHAAKALAEQGFIFVIRNLSPDAPGTADGLDAAEAATILQAGLGLMAVQTAIKADWSPGATGGARDGRRAVAQARKLGLPAGVSLWLRLGAATASGDRLSAYCTSWHAAVVQGGYLPGLQHPSTGSVGAGAALPFALYWRAGAGAGAGAGTQPDAGRSDCLVQPVTRSEALDGLNYDWVAVQASAAGQLPCWCSGA